MRKLCFRGGHHHAFNRRMLRSPLHHQGRLAKLLNLYVSDTLAFWLGGCGGASAVGGGSLVMTTLSACLARAGGRRDAPAGRRREAAAAPGVDGHAAPRGRVWAQQRPPAAAGRQHA